MTDRSRGSWGISRWFCGLVGLLFVGFSVGQTRSEPVQGALAMHGHSLRVDRVTSPLSAQLAARESAARWRAEVGSEPSTARSLKPLRFDPFSVVLELHQPPWWIVTRLRGDWIETMQWREHESGGAEGIHLIGLGTGASRINHLGAETASITAWPRGLVPAEHLGLQLVAQSQTHDRVVTALYRSQASPGDLQRRWLVALRAASFSAALPAGLQRRSRVDSTQDLHNSDQDCAALQTHRSHGCLGAERRGSDELMWTIANESGGSALVIHRLERTP